MNTFFGSAFESLLVRLQQTFEQNTGQKWMELALGWVLQAGPKTVAGMLRTVNGIRTRAFSAYYALLRSQWFDCQQYWNTIQGILLEGIDDGRIRLIVDDKVTSPPIQLAVLTEPPRLSSSDRGSNQCIGIIPSVRFW